MKSKKMLKPVALITAAAITTTAVVVSMSYTLGAEENEYKWTATAPDTSLRKYSAANILTPGQKIERFTNGVKSVSSSNANILAGSYVKNDSSINYRITAKNQPGIATVALANKTGALLTTNYLVKNNTDYIESYELKHKTITISQVGGTDDVRVQVDKLNDSSVTEELWKTITWTSYDEDIASVTTDGKVTAKAKGDTVIKGDFTDCYGEKESILFALSVAPSTGTTSNDTIVTINGKKYIDHGDNTFTSVDANGILGERVGGGSDHDPTTNPVGPIVIIDGKPYIQSADGNTLIGVGSNGLLESNGVNDIVGDPEVKDFSENKIVVNEDTNKIYKSIGHNVYQEVKVASDGSYVVTDSTTYIVAGHDLTPGTDDDNLLSGRTKAMGGQIAIKDLDVKEFTYKITGALDKYTVSAGYDGLLGTYDDVISTYDGWLGILSYSASNVNKAVEEGDYSTWNVTWQYMGGTVTDMKLISEYTFDSGVQFYTQEVDAKNLAAADYAIRTKAPSYDTSTLPTKFSDLYVQMGRPRALKSQIIYMSESQSGKAHAVECMTTHQDTTGYTAAALYASHMHTTAVYVRLDPYANNSSKTGNTYSQYLYAPSISEIVTAFGDSTAIRNDPIFDYRKGRTDKSDSGFGEYWLRSNSNNKYMHVNAIGEDGVIYGTRKTYDGAQLRPCCLADLTVT